LAFALCWEESRFNPQAENRKNRNASIDRGLFQLNDRSFPALNGADFFNPRINSYYAMAHLRWCLNSGGTEIAALAMYNAGVHRVANLGTPKGTLDYVHRVLQNRDRLEGAFAAFTGTFRQDEENAAPPEAEEETRPRFFRLSPLLVPGR
jgi:soluble lytic murein transglycosylase-like protein